MTSSTPHYAITLASLVLLSLTPLALDAQETKKEVLYTAVVNVPQAEVRCGPGNNEQLYVTNRLAKGEILEVVGETPDGWLAIVPPPGSFSWINNLFVKQVNAAQDHWVVVGAPNKKVPIYVGSEVKAGRPTVSNTSLIPGTLMRVIGRTMSDEGSVWLPIEAPISERRYIRKSAVRKLDSKEAVAAAKRSSSQNNTSFDASRIDPTSKRTTPPTPYSSTNLGLLWQQAQNAERSRDYAEAIRLYGQITTEAIKSNPNFANAAANRAGQLRQWLKGQRTYGVSTSQGTSTVPSPQARLRAPVPSYESNRGAGTQSTFTPTSPTTPGHGNRLYSSGPGVLRASGRFQDGRRMYVLESTQGYPRLYVTVGPSVNVNLEMYVNRMVELVGPSWYDGGLRANHMTVERVQLLQ